MRALIRLLGVVAVLGGCCDPPCAEGERKVGSVCVEEEGGGGLGELDAGPFAVVDGGPAESGRGDSGSPDLPASADGSMPMAPEASARALKSFGTCSLPGHCATWPMPDFAGKFLSAYVRENGTVRDIVTALVWQDSLGPNVDYFAAETYCENLMLASHDDWRMPTLIEVMSLFSPNLTHPAIDRNGFPDAKNDSHQIFAARSTSAGQEVFHFIVMGGGGSTLKWSIEKVSDIAAQVRCVRAGRPPNGPRYTLDERDQTILDNWTSLTWRRREEPGALLLQEARERCTSLGGAWRLPTAKELVTLVDPVAADPAIDAEAFPGTTPGPFWSSTEVTAYRNGGVEKFQHLVEFGTKPVYPNVSIGGTLPKPDNRFYVRCVR